MTPSELGQCVDCPPGTKRKVVGARKPRCATHRRAQRLAASERRYALHLQRTYGITIEDYRALYEAQGGRCALCERATGKTRRLSVDHDHKIGNVWGAVRGLICRPCNDFLGHLRDNPALARKFAAYLEDPPAQAVLRNRRGLA